MPDVLINVSKGWQGFKYFWAVRVTGFNPNFHCQDCLIGDRLWQVKAPLAAGGQAVIPAKIGDLIYLCGVAEPYIWKNNFHLPFRVTPGATASGKLYTTATVEVLNGEETPFTDERAKQLYPKKSAAFLTCRNFQWAAEYIPVTESTRHPRFANRKR